MQNEEQLIADNTKLIHYCIQRMNLFYKTEDEYQDYYDDGLIGLITGVKTFDETKEVKLSTYLYQCIKNKILQGIREKTTDKRKANNNAISLNTTVSDETEHELYEIIPDETIDVEKEAEQKIQLEAIIKSLTELDNKEATIFKMYYGLEGYEPKKHKEIAEEFDISQSYVSRIITKVTNDIKSKVKKNERKIIMNDKKTPVFKQEQEMNPLDEVNLILMEQLRRLRGLDLNDKEDAKLEIARSNAISSTSKTILQTIGIQLMAKKHQLKLTNTSIK